VSRPCFPVRLSPPVASPPQIDEVIVNFNAKIIDIAKSGGFDYPEDAPLDSIAAIARSSVAGSAIMLTESATLEDVGVEGSAYNLEITMKQVHDDTPIGMAKMIDMMLKGVTVSTVGS
jgi:hypothetical protein